MASTLNTSLTSSTFYHPLSHQEIVASHDMESDIFDTDLSNKSLAVVQSALHSVVKNCSDDPKRLELIVAEILAKGFAYCRITEDNDSLDVPQLIENKEVVLVPYKAYAWDLGNSNFAYILEPKLHKTQAAPIVLFRGTCPKEFGTIHASIGALGTSNLLFDSYWGFGSSVVESKKGEFRLVVKELREKYGSKIQCIGHSLGGVLAQRLPLSSLDDVERIYSFSAPGIPSKEVQIFNDVLQKKTRDEQQKILEGIKVINTKGDVINTLGHQWHIGKKLYFIPNEKLSRRELHSTAVLAQGGYLVEKKVKIAHSLIEKIGFAVIYPVRCIAVLALTIASFLLFDVLILHINNLFSDDISSRSIAHDLVKDEQKRMQDQGRTLPCLEKIKMHSKLWWSLDIHKIRANYNEHHEPISEYHRFCEA